jgi:PIN domain nuclease of toxin-antitoxin system
MKLLVDSNALVWWISDPERLSRRADSLIRDQSNELLVSFASLWELTIKVAKGNLSQLGSSIQYLLDELRAQRMEILALRTDHLVALGNLDPHHRDPFDRLLIAQAAVEKVPIVTSDPIFRRYGVKVLW